MINALMARNNAYKSVRLFSHEDVMNKLYGYIDNRVEEVSKRGDMSICFFLDSMVKKSVGINLSIGQLKMLADCIETRYKENGFSAKCDDAHSKDCFIVEIGWFSI